MEIDATAIAPEAKVDFILKAAQKRLGLYGYEKTTMQEIADDILMSKAALYYYFPDKESLFKAVIENEQNEFYILLEKRIAVSANADTTIMEIVELRHSLFRKFHNLSKFRHSDYHTMKPLLKTLYEKMREIETETLTKAFNEGKEKGIFYFENAGELALLFSDLLQGIRIMEMKRMDGLEMTNEENEVLLNKLRFTTLLFLNGLKYNNITKVENSK
jgi:TetR/AcrR family transcriptional regulator